MTNTGKSILVWVHVEPNTCDGQTRIRNGIELYAELGNIEICYSEFAILQEQGIRRVLKGWDFKYHRSNRILSQMRNNSFRDRKQCIPSHRGNVNGLAGVKIKVW